MSCMCYKHILLCTQKQQHTHTHTHTLAFSVAYLTFDVHPVLICLVQLLHQQMAQEYCLI